MIRAIAIDDEPVALEVIRMHLDHVPAIVVVGMFQNAAEALSFISTQQVDLVFLDINMPGMNGLDFAKQVPAGTQLIFTTAHTDYALQGFDLAITDFLLKPIGLQRFQQACELVQKRFMKPVHAFNDAVIFIRDGYDLVQLRLSGLIYIKADDNYLSFVEKNRYTLTRMTMNEALARLASHSFLKVHKSYIVNLDFIEKISDGKIILQSRNEQIPVSRTMLQQLKDNLANHRRQV
jgi:two-component system, LytTR family, response regulator